MRHINAANHQVKELSMHPVKERAGLIRKRKPRAGLGRVWLLACASALLLGACGGDDGGSASSGGSDTAPKSSEPIVIGAAVAASGFVEPFDKPGLNAFKLAMEDINAEGGIDGRKLELIEGDTRSDINGTPAVAQDLISRKAEVMLVTCDYDFGAPAANVAQKAGIVSFTLCATSPKFGVQGIGDKAYDPMASVGNEGAVLATWAISKGWKKADVMLDGSLAYTRGLCSSFTKFFKELGGEIVAEQKVKQDGTSNGTQVNRLASSGADVAIVCSYPPGGASLVRAIRAADIDIPLISGNGFAGEYWTDAVPGLKDFYAIANSSLFGDDPNDEVNEFTKKYVAKYGTPSTSSAAGGYAIGQMLKDAIKRAGGTDGAKLSAALNELKEFPTIVGPVSYDETTHIALDRPLAILRFTDGKAAYEETVKPGVEVTLTDGAS
jgi:branched-chain amino acid transport system substrate-binding protein